MAHNTMPRKTNYDWYEAGRKSFEGVAHCIRFECLMNTIWDNTDTPDCQVVAAFFDLTGNRHEHVSSNAIKVAQLIGFTPKMDWETGDCVIRFDDGSGCILPVHGGAVETFFE